MEPQTGPRLRRAPPRGLELELQAQPLVLADPQAQLPLLKLWEVWKELVGQLAQLWRRRLRLLELLPLHQ